MIPDVDPATVAAAKRLEPSAIAAIYDAFADPIFRFISFRIPSPEDAEDLTDQVFLKMIEALPRYRDRGTPLGAWLYRIARNLITDRYRRKGRDSVELKDSLAATGPEANPFEAASGALTRETIMRALDTLTAEQREVIILRFIEGWDVADVATYMKRKPNAIHALQHRAVLSLREVLSPAEEAPA